MEKEPTGLMKMSKTTQAVVRLTYEIKSMININF
jgi:hypothetical protein